MTFQELLEKKGYQTRSYSGRGMSGLECLGVTVDDPGEALAIGYALGKSGIPFPGGVRRDQMGKQWILYWPLVEYVEKEDL